MTDTNIKLHHVSFIVEDINIAQAFYTEVLDLKLDNHRPDLGYPGVWFSLPGQQQLHLMQLDDPDKDSERPEHGGRDRHIAFAVKSLDDIIAKLEERGIAYNKSKSGRQALFCRDPDGNALEFIQV